MYLSGPVWLLRRMRVNAASAAVLLDSRRYIQDADNLKKRLGRERLSVQCVQYPATLIFKTTQLAI